MKSGVLGRAGGGYLVLYLLAFLISLIFNIGHDKTSDFVHYFLIGYALFKFEVLTSLHYKNFWMCICLIFGCFIVKGIGEEGMNFWEFHFKEFLFGYSLHIYILRILASTLICVFFVLLIKNVSREYGRFSFWGSKALPLYMVHALFINIFYNLPIYYELKGFYYFIYAIPATVLLTFASMLLIKLFMKYDLTQTYCLGEIK